MSKGVMGNGVLLLWPLIEDQAVLALRSKQHNDRVFSMIFPSFLFNTVNLKLLLPIIPIGIVAHAFTLCGRTVVETALHYIRTYVEIRHMNFEDIFLSANFFFVLVLNARYLKLSHHSRGNKNKTPNLALSKCRSPLPGASIFDTDPLSQPFPVSFYF